MDDVGFIGLHTPQGVRPSAPLVTGVAVPVEERDTEWGAFSGGEFTDGAGALHLVEGRFMARNNNIVFITHRWPGGEENITLGDPAVNKIDDFNLNLANGRIRIRAHEYGPTGVLRQMGGIRGGAALAGWTPVAGGGSVALALPAYDPNVAPFPDVPPGDAFHKPISQLKALGIISGKGDGKFHEGDGVTRGQVAKIAWGVIEAIARLLKP